MGIASTGLYKNDLILIQLACVQVLFGLSWSVIIPARCNWLILKKLFIKYQIDFSKLNPSYESLAVTTYFSFPSFNSSDSFLPLQIFDR